MSGLMQQALYQFGVKQCISYVYHPESKDALERFHQTLKNYDESLLHGTW